MKLAIITSRYPSHNNPYNHMFVHTRSLYFIQQSNVDLAVFVPSVKEEQYTYEDVKVLKKPAHKIADEIKNFDIVYLHLLNIHINPSTSGWKIYQSIINNNIPVAIYLHGSEVQKYATRSFDFDYSLKEMAKYFYKDWYFIPRIRKFIHFINKRKNSLFLAPSKWMIEEAEKNLSLKINNYQVIPNGIDTDLFKFHDLYHNRYKMLVIRPLKKLYALDIVLEVFSRLPKEFTLDIYGEGQEINQIKRYIVVNNLEKRVKIINTFIEHNNLNYLYIKYGCIFSLSRSDSQGVTRCEAMASGLLTINSNVSAIPEFITDMENGILGDNNNPEEISKKILKVVEDKNLYQYICVNARKSIDKIAISNTMKKELNVLKSIIK